MCLATCLLILTSVARMAKRYKGEVRSTSPHYASQSYIPLFNGMTFQHEGSPRMNCFFCSFRGFTFSFFCKILKVQNNKSCRGIQNGEMSGEMSSETCTMHHPQANGLNSGHANRQRTPQTRYDDEAASERHRCWRMHKSWKDISVFFLNTRTTSHTWTNHTPWRGRGRPEGGGRDLHSKNRQEKKQERF